MLDHPIIDVTIGLVFFYTLFSLAASAVQEWIASLVGLRARNLRAGIERLVGNDYAKKVYEHPLIGNLAKKGKLPSYIKSETFTTVILDIVKKDVPDKIVDNGNGTDILDAIRTIDESHPLRSVLETLAGGASNLQDELSDKFASWFDEGMTRVSGWYKRQTKWIILVIALVVTIGTNASTIHIAEELWANDALRSAIAVQAQNVSVQQNLLDSGSNEIIESINEFPFGWEKLPNSVIEWVKSILGWVLTAAAVSLGAPFWFHLLGKVANIRGSGGQTATGNGK